MVKNPPANAGSLGSIPGSERSPGGGKGNSLLHSCLENPMDRGACGFTVHGVAKELDATQQQQKHCLFRHSATAHLTESSIVCT